MAILIPIRSLQDVDGVDPEIIGLIQSMEELTSYSITQLIRQMIVANYPEVTKPIIEKVVDDNNQLPFWLMIEPQEASLLQKLEATFPQYDRGQILNALILLGYRLSQKSDEKS